MTAWALLSSPFHYVKFFFPLFLVSFSLYGLIHGATPGWNLLWVIGGLIVLEFSSGNRVQPRLSAPRHICRDDVLLYPRDAVVISHLHMGLGFPFRWP